ncbi:MAG: hypothetical protein CVU89_00665 [Firmicutes bacterium HGW-Firmicutes-14]|nr:MAG: hypothetical protein CVU89_00665 [Firmicutes bacterium HGW-Firmicutes-14]
MDKIRSVLSKHKNKLLSMKNVVGVGIGYKDSAIEVSTGQPKMGVVVLVKHKLPESQLEAHNIVPKDLEGVVTDVIEVGDLRLLSRTERGIPAQPGVSIGHYKITAGTFGAVVKDRKTGQSLILSNNHVLANGTNGRDKRAKVGDPILLPGPHDGGLMDKDRIGVLFRFKPIDKLYTQSACPKAASAEFWVNALCRLVAPEYMVKVLRESETGNLIDAAVAKPLNPGKINPEILDIGQVKGVAEAEVGMKVVKSGRTTGVTNGTIKAVNATVQVDMGDGEEAVFEDQIIASPMSQGGDSGSLVLDDKKRAIGLLFAGSDKTTVFNKIQNVMEQLDITF